MDIGDIIGVEGFVFRTKTGEISIHGRSLVLLAKSLRPIPTPKEKVDEQGNKTVYDPFSDKELRYRQRYVDLLVNPQIREVFVKRARIITAVRSFLTARGFEVETPGPAPEVCRSLHHHNALMLILLCIADELTEAADRRGI
jgi:lysyl-tRNA synthetase class 2